MSTHREIMSDYYGEIQAKSRILGGSMMTVIADDDDERPEDDMTKLDRRRIFAIRLSNLLLLAETASIPIVIFAYYRTAEEQHKLFLEKKSKCDGYQRRSKHQDWLACDIGIVNAEGTDFLWTDERYRKLGELGESLGLTWGGRWASLNDVYHFELGEE